MISDQLIQAIQAQYKASFGYYPDFYEAKPIGGGCISHAYKVLTSEGNLFIKYIASGRYPGMYETEAKGLELLESTNTFDIPKPLFFGTSTDFDYLVTSFIEEGRHKDRFWKDFGRYLAVLHRNSRIEFGLDYDNYIGSLPQSNSPETDWKTFFILHRIEPLLKICIDKGLLNSDDLSMFDRLFARFDELIPTEAPALLHGDLWNGNYLVNHGGEASLIDPAVYYGHREMDISMTWLFGGFEMEFYDAYMEVNPLEQGWQQRTKIHNLYPLLVHAILFEGNYANQIRSVISLF